MSTFSLEALLGLFSIPSIGPARMRKLISALGSPQNVLQAGMRRLMSIDGIDRKTAEKILNGPNREFVEEQLQGIRERQIGILSFWDDAYPARLKRIYDPPAFLFYMGNLDVLNDKMFAVVGTRVPTTYGRVVSERLTKDLVDKGFTIISGFARGIDTLAHKSALKNHGRTVAVLGNGLDVIYPSENKALFEEVCQAGLFLTEYPLGTKPDAGNFPKRNRIISGMSSGVLITEAAAKSGALLTSMYAVEQDREVFAVPGPIYSGKSTGTNNLIKSGAKLVQHIDDIMEELGGQFNEALQKSTGGADPGKLSGNYLVVYNALDMSPVHIDQLALKTNLAPSEILSILLTLELGGYVQQLAGKMFLRA